MATSLVGKVAIVTGSSRSIGAAMAERLAEDGTDVVINYYTNSQMADEVVNATLFREGKTEQQIQFIAGLNPSKQLGE
jgi:3-oxoacyl-[acyl-carrier protein] reductase